VKAYIEAHGCALNRGEALEFKSILKSAGWDMASNPESADMNFIATCAVIETTEREMMKRIRQLNDAGKPLIVTGCMASVLRSKIEPIAPKAMFVEPDSLDELCKVVGLSEDKKWTPIPYPNTFCHIVPIASGCLGNCEYCITKNARGNLNSRSEETIIDEISRIEFSLGVKEIQITAQDTAAYGKDLGSSLPKLLNSLAQSEFDIMIRVGMMNPRTVMSNLDDLVAAYSNHKIFKFLHLPIQSASNRLLKDMSRGYTVQDFEMIVKEFREWFPELTLSTDLIVGYPGETREDHTANMKFLRRVKPDIVNITRFSPRPGTGAANVNEKIPGWVTKARSRELTILRFQLSNAKNRDKLDKIVDTVVTEKGSKSTMIARTSNYEQVILPRSVDLGQRITARITDYSSIHLIGYPQ